MFDQETQAKFEALVDRRAEDECWEWRGSYSNGYGMFNAAGRQVKAHRYSLARIDGVLPGSDVFGLHSCDNPRCCNPSHLRWGNAQDNVDDMVSRRRSGAQQKTHCKRGHLLAGDNLRQRGLHKGWRECVTCYEYGLLKRSVANQDVSLPPPADHYQPVHTRQKPDRQAQIAEQESALAELRSSARRELKTHCSHGHPLVAGNLLIARLKKGWLACALCHAISLRARVLPFEQAVEAVMQHRPELAVFSPTHRSGGE